jgi:hypothetical protein
MFPYAPLPRTRNTSVSYVNHANDSNNHPAAFANDRVPVTNVPPIVDAAHTSLASNILPYVDPYAPDDENRQPRVVVTPSDARLLNQYLEVDNVFRRMPVTRAPATTNVAPPIATAMAAAAAAATNTGGQLILSTTSHVDQHNFYTDPLASIGPSHSRLRQVIQNHIYIVESMCALQRWQSVDPKHRTYMTIAFIMRYAAQAGLALDLPSVDLMEELLRFERRDKSDDTLALGNRQSIVDTSFVYAVDTHTLTITMRFTEERPPTAPEGTESENETIDLDKLGSAELTALIEDRIYCRLTFTVHEADREALQRAIQSHVPPPNVTNANVLKAMWVARTAATGNVRVMFVNYAFLVR